MGNAVATGKTSALPAALTTCAPRELATFGAGCYWGTEKYFRDFAAAHQGGVVDMRVGFMGDASAMKDPSYKDVCSGASGHVEVLHLRFDPNKVTYASLVEHFFTFHDSTTANRQGNDMGPQYASVIFTHTAEQAETARATIAKLQKLIDTGAISPGFLGQKVQTAVRPANTFYPAHDAHQRYLEANPTGYCNHRKRFTWPKQ
jgi:peptide-methionine (S)-S-oxide reductase